MGGGIGDLRMSPSTLPPTMGPGMESAQGLSGNGKMRPRGHMPVTLFPASFLCRVGLKQVPDGSEEGGSGVGGIGDLRMSPSTLPPTMDTGMGRHSHEPSRITFPKSRVAGRGSVPVEPVFQ